MTITRSDVVAWYELQRDARDIINSNDGTVNGASLSTDAPFDNLVGSYDFVPSQGDYIDANDVGVSERSSFTVAMWVNPDVLEDGRCVFQETNQSDFVSDTLNIYVESGGNVHVFYTDASGNGGSIIDYTSSISTSEWNHIAFVDDNGTHRLYINGSEVATDNTAINQLTTDSTLIGIDTGSFIGNNKFDGQIGQTVLLNKAATSTEISNLAGGVTARSQFPLTDGLQAYYKLDGDATDSEGSNDGTVNGATFTQGRIGQSAIFDGSNDYVITSTNAIEVFTVSGWIKPNVLNEFQVMASRGNFDNDTRNFWLGTSNEFEQAYFSIQNTAGNGDIAKGGSLSTNTWHHLAGVSTGSEMRLYVDGALVNTISMSETVVTSNDATTIGAGKEGKGYFFDGEIDEVAIYNQALTSGEVRRLYSYGVGLRYEDLDRNTPLVDGVTAAYNADTNGSFPDAKNNTYDGTISGATYTSSGKINGAYNFDGTTNTRIDIPVGLYGSGSWSHSLWLNPDSTSGTQKVLNSDGSLTVWLHYNRNTAKTVTMGVWDGSTLHELDSTSTLNPGTWSHVVFGYDGTQCFAAVNGVVEVNSTCNAPFGSSTESTLGYQQSSGNENPYDGQVDEFGMWSRALTSSEITNLYNAGSGQQFPYTFVPLNAPGKVFRTLNGVIQTIPTAIKETK